MEDRIAYLMSLKKANLMRMRDLLLTNNTEEMKRTKHSYELIEAELNRVNNSLYKPYPQQALKIDDLLITTDNLLSNPRPSKGECVYGDFKTLEQEQQELLPKIYDNNVFKYEYSSKPQEEKLSTVVKEDNNQSEYLDQMYSLYD